MSDQEEHEAREVHRERLHDHEHAHDQVHDHGHDHGGDSHDHDHDGHPRDHDHGDDGHPHDEHDREDAHEDHDGHEHALIVDRLPTGVWRVDHGSSEVNFRARALFGLLPVNGFFDEFSGDLVVDFAGNAHGTLVVQTATLKSGIDRRDADLTSARYLASSEYPQMTFTLEAIESSGDDHLELTGALAIRDRTIPLSFPVYAIQHGDHLHIEGRVQIDHHAAGFEWAKPGMVAKTVRADVALTLISTG